MELGTRIKQLRTERKLSQEAVAEKLNLSRQAVAKWESNASLPSTANLMALCEIFEVSLMELTAPDAPAESKEVRKGCRILRLVLFAASLAFTLLSVAALALTRGNPLPENIIGYADGETGIAVFGTPFPVYLLCAFTLLLILATVFVWFRSGRRGRKK